ncbi:MAG TPA: alanine/ornithine racemase family PLP-dependent enzyme [Edaphocola sp.]|nr:alanine/ornithine racemase family PLP-dependent enzyme [Edaphocola sp.]
MAFITLNTQKLRDNYQYLDRLFNDHNIEWSVVSKLLCGNRLYLEELLKLPVRQVCDSRISNLKTIKSIRPDIETVYIKPPAKRSIRSIVTYADTSFNTEFDTIKRLSEAAKAAGKVHKIVIMIELGELREGVMREEFIDFYESVFKLPNIKVAGIGTNLTCMYGILPNHDKLIQLSLYKQLVEAKFNRKIPYVSGGASVTIPLIAHRLLPEAVNHFRVGETLYLGTDVYHNRPFDNMHNDVFKLFAEVIELNEKPVVPQGEFGYNLNGEKASFDESLSGETSQRAIVDVGLLDIEEAHIQPRNPDIKIVGASSDMIVLDLKDNREKVKVGDLIEFHMDYMGVLRVMNSSYVEKRIEYAASENQARLVKQASFKPMP